MEGKKIRKIVFSGWGEGHTTFSNYGMGRKGFILMLFFKIYTCMLNIL